MQKLKEFPILQELVSTYRRINRKERESKGKEYIEEDIVLNYAESEGTPSNRVYLFSNKNAKGRVKADRYVKCYDKGKEIILLTIYRENSVIDYHQFKYNEYPFQEELKRNYSEESSLNYKFEKDVNYAYKKRVLEQTQEVIAEYA